jgi:purine-nucleoside phosphorylase
MADLPSNSLPATDVVAQVEDYFDRVREAVAFLQARLPRTPEIAVVLGSGLGDFASTLTDAVSLKFDEIPHWPAAAVIGHEGKLVFGKTSSGREILALAGRVHFYEGHDLRTVTFATRVLGLLGVKMLILTNAAGGINTSFAQGALMVIDDHINLLGSNPLVGPNDLRFGQRFPDMTEVYSKRLRALAHDVEAQAGLTLEHGVYVALHGPSYETPAEIRYLRTIGADAVGMSTVPEAIVARHMGLEVLGISCITNMAAGVLPAPLNHDEVMETARRVRTQFVALLEAIIARA